MASTTFYYPNTGTSSSQGDGTKHSPGTNSNGGHDNFDDDDVVFTVPGSSSSDVDPIFECDDDEEHQEDNGEGEGEVINEDDDEAGTAGVKMEEGS